MIGKKEAFDIVLLAGQSNAEGYGRGPAAEEYPPVGEILHMNTQRKTENTDGAERWSIDIQEADSLRKDDLSLAFAHEYVQKGLLSEGRKLLLINAAVGGTSFVSGYWKMQGNGYRRMQYMLNYALKLNPENRVVAILWHQGESDAIEHNPPEQYHEQLTAFFESIRTRCGNSLLPLVTGDFVAHWKNRHLDICEPIVEQIRLVTEKLGGIFVETSDLPSNDQAGARENDDIHFSRNSMHILGRRYFDAYCTILERSSQI